VTRRRLVLFLIASVVVLMAVFAGPALAVNDPFTPAEDCDADQGEAVGHPAAAREQSDLAGPPFSSNNPGVSVGAEGDGSGATVHCANAQP
jgi:hypothetical protein